MIGAQLALCCALGAALDIPKTETASTSLEWGTVPGVALDSALGLGLANLLNLARLDPEVAPYAWRLNLLTQVFIGKRASGGIAPTLQRHRLQFDAPRFVQEGLRLTAELSFFRLVNSGFYGVGNAAQAETPWAAIDEQAAPEAYAAARRFHEYDRITPGARAVLRVAAGGEVELFAGGSLDWSWLDVYPDSRLAQALAAGDRLIGVERHGRLEGTVGVLYEARDDEIDPDEGPFHELSLRAGQLLEIPGTYGGVNLTLRHFLPLWRTRLVFAARAVLDVLFGDAPIYELARYGGLQPGDGIAGPLGVRGPRVQRYHGKVKVFGNLELRSRLVHFRLFGARTTVGLVGFFDAGRVWAELRPRPDLDGEGLGLKYAVGGGFRYRWGSSFVVRGDLGWSQDGVLFSVDAGHVF